MTSRRIVVVLWTDAVAELNHSWIALDDFTPYPQGGLPCVTVGHVIHEDDKGISLAQTCTATDSIDNIITLPKGMIIEIKEVKLGKRH